MGECNAIPEWWALFVDVAVWPVCSPMPALEQRSFLLERLYCGKLGWCLTDILHVADAVAFGEASIVHGAAIPESLEDM